MNDTLKQMHKIEKNINSINDPELLRAINTKYRQLETKLKEVTNNIDVIFEII